MSRYKLVRLPNGSHAVYSAGYDEKMHPGLGPQAEADLLYVRQLKIPERMHEGRGASRSAAVPSRSTQASIQTAAAGDSRAPGYEEFVVWDVGLGAAAN